MAELDIWMRADAHCGKGLGSDALIALSDYLHSEMGVRRLIMTPAAKNTRAVRAYEKAGFYKTDAPMRAFLTPAYADVFGDGDYGIDETVILLKQYEA